MPQTKTSGVYMIRNSLTGEAYIGSSKNIHHRWQTHKSKTKHGSNSLLHQAIREYGIDNFELSVLVEADENLPYLELQYILSHSTFYPNGYNVGATVSGWMPKTLFNKLPIELRNRWKEIYANASVVGIETIRLLREDPAYEAEYLAIKSLASTKREKNIRERRNADPAYDAQEHVRRVKGGKAVAAKYPNGELQRKAAITFKERFETDADYAKRISENRAKAARIGWERRRNAAVS